MQRFSNLQGAPAAAHSCEMLSSRASLSCAALVARPRQQRRSRAQACPAQNASQDPLLLRVARGEEGERPPVWLMRQAGRYMKEFRAYSDKYPFRMRSETPEIAIELSMQPWRVFKPDGVIMFSDILTPLPAMGIEFDVVKGDGPVIPSPIRTMDDVKALKVLDDPSKSLPFVSEILKALRKEVDGQSTLLGFIGTPWTLAAYAIEGSSNKYCMRSKKMMQHNPEVLHAFLAHLADSLATYVCFQIESGAQVVQLFDSWAHHLSPQQFAEFSLPYAERVIQKVRAKHPKVPLIFHANGSAGKEHKMVASTADVIGLDWNTQMAVARKTFGAARTLQGNVDPMYLFGTEASIRAAVAECVAEAGGRHILNVGHGVAQGTPEENVKLFCDLARQSVYAKKAPAAR